MNPLADKVLFPHSGTFSANPVTMVAGLTAMRLFDEAAVDRLNGLASRAVEGLEAAIARTGIHACVTGGGSMFRVHMKAQAPRNYREAYLDADEQRRLAIMLDHLFDAGFIMINTCAGVLSTPMTEVEVDALVAAMAEGFAKVMEETP